MKFDIYFWPRNEQAWVLSWGLRDTMQSMGVLRRFGDIEMWTKRDEIPKLLDTDADAILFVGFEHFRDRIPTNAIKHNKAKMICWLYESITDPYGAIAWDNALNHFLKETPDFHNGFTRYADDSLSYFDCMDTIFCADELDCERLKNRGMNASWLPFGVDEQMFRPGGQTLHNWAIYAKNPQLTDTVQKTRRSLIDTAKIRYGTRYGVRSGRSNKTIVDLRPIPTTNLPQGKAAFIGTKSNVRAIILNRIGINSIDIVQTARRGKFSHYETAITHTKSLVKAYTDYLISINLVSIFGGITPRALESMSCGRTLFQYICAPNRPLSRKMLSSCVKYEVFTPAGLNEFREKLRYYITHPREAILMGRAAREEVTQGHTLKHRIMTIINKLNETTKRLDLPSKIQMGVNDA
jgi:hypothetical protein